MQEEGLFTNLYSDEFLSITVQKLFPDKIYNNFIATPGGIIGLFIIFYIDSEIETCIHVFIYFNASEKMTIKMCRNAACIMLTCRCKIKCYSKT